MNDFYVYTYTVPGEEKPFYVGKGRGDRSRYHLRPTMLRRGKTLLYHKLRKMLAAGIEPLIEVVRDGLTEHEAFEIERSLIAQYGRRSLGTGVLCNLTDGGDGASNPDDDVRRRMSESHKGLPRSETHRQRLSEAHMGRRLPEVHKQKLSVARRGRVVTEETRIKTSATLRKLNGKPVESYSPDTGETIKRYPAIVAVRDDGFNDTCVSRVLSGVFRTYKRLGWRYACNTSADTFTTRPP